MNTLLFERSVWFVTDPLAVEEEVLEMEDVIYHRSVLEKAVVELLEPRPGALIVDGTCGGGGHTQVLLESGADVLALDQDPDAVQHVSERLERFGKRVTVQQANFRDAAKILVIWFAAFVPAVINSHAGVRSIEPHLIEAARSLGIRGPMLVREVLLPGAMPLVFTGLRLSMQACWTTLVAGELIGAILGLGHVLYQAGLDIFPAMIVVGMAAVAVAGGLTTLALGWLEDRALPWRRR